MSNSETIAMIPARKGSERLRLKNLALVGGKPLIEHSIAAALAADVFDRIIINSDSPVFEPIADRTGVDFYLRAPEIASSEARSDEVVEDFFKSFHDCETLFWINPIAPLQTAAEIIEGVSYFTDNKLDSMIAGIEKRVHCMYEGKPLNFNAHGLFEKTQDLEPVVEFTYSIMGWRRSTFLDSMTHNGSGVISGNFGVFKSNAHSAFLVKTADDLALINSWVGADGQGFVVEYDELAKGI